MEQDEDLYLKAHKELNAKSKKEAVWIKALTLCKGDTEAAKYEYINLRVESFKIKIVSKEEPILKTSERDNNIEDIYQGYTYIKANEKNKIGWHTYKIIKAPHFDENSIGYSFVNYELFKVYVDSKENAPQNIVESKKNFNQWLNSNDSQSPVDHPKVKIQSEKKYDSYGLSIINLIKNKADKEEQEPGRFRYICAWIIASVSSNILTTIISLMLGKNISSQAEFDAYYFYSPFIGGILALSIWIGVVNIDYYKYLKISKLTFWISIVGGLGTIGQMYKTQMSLKISGASAPTHFFIMTVIVFIAWVTAFYFYGAKKNRL